MKHTLSRRDFIKMMLGLPVAYLLAACGLKPAAPTVQSPTAAPPTAAPADDTAATTVAAVPTWPPTPACGDDDDDPTPSQTTGPFYTPNTPERTSFLEDGLAGTTLVISGVVMNTQCQPVANALLDFWHCDSNGVYDNAGYKLRGHQYADANGGYTLETILPGLYPGRTRHIHVRVQAPNQPVLTTQLYFPDEPGNATDGIFDEALVMEVDDSADGKRAAFNFVLSAG